MARRAVDHPRIGNLRTPVTIWSPNLADGDGQGGINAGNFTQVGGVVFMEVRSPTGSEVWLGGRLESRISHVITARDVPGGLDVRPGYEIRMVTPADRMFRVQDVKRVQERGVWVVMTALENSADSGAGC